GGTGIALGTLEVSHDLRFLRGGNCHWFCSPKKSAAFYPLSGLLLKPNILTRYGLCGFVLPRRPREEAADWRQSCLGKSGRGARIRGPGQL
ncbi:MAG: hypothetical protein M0P42_14515, partial [Gallionella sp.]|nr:hypothetical protein [Gallionella sp.]